MPSVKRLFPAAFLAMTAWIVANMYIKYLPEGTDVGKFREVCALMGLVLGWVSVGKRIGAGYRAGLEAGLLGATLLVFWAAGSFSVREMLNRSLDRRYKKGLGQAFTDLFNIMADNALSLLHVDLLVALTIGGAISGLVGQWAFRRWK